MTKNNDTTKIVRPILNSIIYLFDNKRNYVLSSLPKTVPQEINTKKTTLKKEILNKNKSSKRNNYSTEKTNKTKTTT